MAVAGVASTVTKLSRFEREWAEILASEGLATFHMTDFVSSNPPFDGWKGDSERRRVFMSRLAAAIRKNFNKIVVYVMDNAEWNSTNAIYQLSERFGNSYSFCALACSDEIRAWADNKVICKNRVEYIFEDGDTGKGHIFDHFKAAGWRTPVFKSKQEAVPCQAADIIAWKNSIALRGSMNKTADYDSAMASLAAVMPPQSHVRIFGNKGKLAQYCEQIDIPRR